MRFGIVFFTLVTLAAAETYNTEHDDLDVKALVFNIEALESFLNCFIDKGPCNEVQRSFKVDLAEAIQQACAKCSLARKNIARNFMAAIVEKLPDGYTAFKNKYDPEDKYFAILLTSLSNTE